MYIHYYRKKINRKSPIVVIFAIIIRELMRNYIFKFFIPIKNEIMSVGNRIT